MTVNIDLENGTAGTDVPGPEQFRHWADTTLECLDQIQQSCSLSIRLVDEEESASLNSQYRGKQGPTNILSFPFSDDYSLPPDIPLPLGDLAICVGVVEREATEQHKPAEAHWAHLTVHGVLHLRGYDHEHEAEAEAMEAIEIRILNTLGYNNPYEQR